MTEAIPWYKSRILLGLLVSVVCKLLVVTGLTGEISSDVETQLLDIVVTLVGLIGDSQILLGRVQQVQAPVITATATGAAKIELEKVIAADPATDTTIDKQAAEVPLWMKP